MGQGRRRGALVRCHRQLPRQRAGRVLLRDPQKRDVLPPPVCHARGGDLRRDRLHRVLLQPQAPPPDNRLQGAGRRDGGVLRALRECVVGAEGGVAGGINPGFFVSEILTQVKVLHRIPLGLGRRGDPCHLDYRHRHRYGDRLRRLYGQETLRYHHGCGEEGAWARIIIPAHMMLDDPDMTQTSDFGCSPNLRVPLALMIAKLTTFHMITLVIEDFYVSKARPCHIFPFLLFITLQA